jgi:hypothetical protein
MNLDSCSQGPALSRRTFLVAGGLGSLGWPLLAQASATPSRQASPKGKARSTILFWLCGGASHIDSWDLKPGAPAEIRGPFQPIATTAPGVRLCEHLPLLAQEAHRLAIVNSLGATLAKNDHHMGYYYNLTGHPPDQTFDAEGDNRRPRSTDWPYLGSVVAARRPPHRSLTNAITLPHRPSGPYVRPGQFAGRLGVEHDPWYVQGSLEQPLEFRAPGLTLEADVTRASLLDRRRLLGAIDQARRDFDQGDTGRYTRIQQKAFAMLQSATTAQAFDLSREPQRLRERYGTTVNGMSLLLARRLVEAGVPFVTVFWMPNPKLAALCKSAGAWDTHGNNFNCLKDHLLPEFDRAFSALIGDLAARGLLDQTLVHVTSEMGRKPKIGDVRSGGVAGAGRDHWTN